MSTLEAYKAELALYLEGFGANVRRLRTSGGPDRSQHWLSDTTGLHRTQIGKLESGGVEPRLTTLVILADGLSVNLDDLVSGLWVPTERKPPAGGHPLATEHPSRGSGNHPG
jgi:transcriptional regulator with XRE-family HTH domain